MSGISIVFNHLDLYTKYDVLILTQLCSDSLLEELPISLNSLNTQQTTDIQLRQAIFGIY